MSVKERSSSRMTANVMAQSIDISNDRNAQKILIQ
jgi:hypothetical protein